MPIDNLLSGELLAPIEETEADGLLVPLPPPDDQAVSMSIMKGMETNPDQRAADNQLSKSSGTNVELISDETRSDIQRRDTQDKTVQATKATKSGGDPY